MKSFKFSDNQGRQWEFNPGELAQMFAVDYMPLKQIDRTPKRPLLTRSVHGPAMLQSEKVKLVGSPQIYATAKLIETFSLPAEVVEQIRVVEVNPAPLPEGWVWGWTLTHDSAHYSHDTAKNYERRLWVFDCHSTITHELMS